MSNDEVLRCVDKNRNQLYPEAKSLVWPGHIASRRSAPFCDWWKSGRKEAWAPGRPRTEVLDRIKNGNSYQSICKKESHGNEVIRIDLPMDRTHTYTHTHTHTDTHTHARVINESIAAAVVVVCLFVFSKTVSCFLRALSRSFETGLPNSTSVRTKTKPPNYEYANCDTFTHPEGGGGGLPYLT